MKKIHWFSLICMVSNAAANVALCVSIRGISPFGMLIALVPSLIVPLGVLLYLLCGDLFGKGKNVLFSVLMSWQLLMAMRGLWSTVPTVASVSTIQTWGIFAVDVLMLGGTVLLLVGSLRGFRRVKLYKIGAFLNAGITVLYLVCSFVGALVVSYFESVPDGVSPVNWLSLAKFVTTFLFYAGLGVLGGEKKEDNG